MFLMNHLPEWCIKTFEHVRHQTHEKQYRFVHYVHRPAQVSKWLAQLIAIIAIEEGKDYYPRMAVGVGVSDIN